MVQEAISGFGLPSSSKRPVINPPWLQQPFSIAPVEESQRRLMEEQSGLAPKRGPDDDTWKYTFGPSERPPASRTSRFLFGDVDPTATGTPEPRFPGAPRFAFKQPEELAHAEWSAQQAGGDLTRDPEFRYDLGASPPLGPMNVRQDPLFTPKVLDVPGELTATATTLAREDNRLGWQAATQHLLPGGMGTFLIDTVLNRLGLDEPVAGQRARATKNALGEFVSEGATLGETVNKLSEIYGDRPAAQQIVFDVVAEMGMQVPGTFAAKAATAAARVATRGVVKAAAQAGPTARQAATAAYEAWLDFDRATEMLPGMNLYVPKVTEKRLLPRVEKNSPTQRLDPPHTGRMLNMKPIVSGLTPMEQISNLIKTPLTWTIPGDEFINPAMRERARISEVGGNVSVSKAQEARAIVESVFTINKKGVIVEPNLQGIDSQVPGAGPSIPDLAARMPVYEPHLSPAQKKAMREVQTIYRPYDELYTEMNIERNTRLDIMSPTESSEGGYYLPRGGAETDFIDDPIAKTRRFRGKPGHEQSARLDSMAQGIDGIDVVDKATGATVRQQFEYRPLVDTLTRYGQDIADRVGDKYTANFLESLVDPDTGKAFYTTAAGRVSPVARRNMSSLKNSIRNTRTTLRDQRVRARQTGAAVTRAEKQLGYREIEVSLAEERLGGKVEAAGEFDLKALQSEVNDAIGAGKDIAERMGKNSELLKKAGRELSNEESKLLDDVDIINTDIELTEGLLNIQPNAQGRELFTDKQVDGLVDRISSLWDRAARVGESKYFQGLEARADKLIEDREILKDRTAGERDALLLGRKSMRNANDANAGLRAANAEMRQLEREMKRSQRRLEAEAKRLGWQEVRETETWAKFESLKAELKDQGGKWQHELGLARGDARGTGHIELRGLEADSWPKHMVDAGNAILKREQRSDSMYGIWGYNNLFRVMGATADLSAIGIQGLVIAANNPVIAARAAMLATMAMGNKKVLGSFTREFNKKARATGRLTSSEWAADGLRQGGAQTEFHLGESAMKRLGSLPIVKHANLAFGYYGDIARLDVADKLLDIEMRKGRSLNDLRNSGETAGIAAHLNKSTGYTTGKLAGNLGELLLFAPKFLKAQIELSIDAARGALPGAKLEHRLAFKRVTTMIGLGTSLTVAANTARGRTTEFNPAKPNFMRIKDVELLGGRDVSLFGPFDGLLKMFVRVLQGEPHEALRQKGSGLVTQVFDLLANRDAVGKPVWSEEGESVFTSDRGDFDPVMFAQNVVVGGHTPFALQETPQLSEMAMSGKPLQAAGVAATETFGIKTAELSRRELLDKERFRFLNEHPELLQRVEDERKRHEIMEFIGRNEPIPESEIPSDILKEIDLDPGVRLAKEALNDDSLSRGSEYARYKVLLNDINVKTNETINNAAMLFEQRIFDEEGYYSGKDFRGAVSAAGKTRADRGKQLKIDYAEDLQFLNDLEPKDTAFDIVLADYYDTIENGDEINGDPLEDPVSGRYDYDERKRREMVWAKRHADGPHVNAVSKYRARNDHEMVKHLDADRASLGAPGSYWSVIDTILEKAVAQHGPHVLEAYEEYQKSPAIEKPERLIRPGGDVLKKIIDAEDINSWHMRCESEDLERKLLRWGYVTSPVKHKFGPPDVKGTPCHPGIIEDLRKEYFDRATRRQQQREGVFQGVN